MKAKTKTKKKNSTLMYFRNHWLLYAMLVLPIADYILFQYLPMYGLLIAFKDYNLFKGVWDSPWVGFNVFQEVFRTSNFWSSIKNTLVLNGLNLLIGFPAPIILALMLNEINNGIFKKGIQTVLYLPHFISWVIIGGMMYQIFSTTSGMVNAVIKTFGGGAVPFLTDNGWWVFVYVVVSVWHEIGWGAIIYMSAITGISADIYEAAKVDGCSRFRMMWNITLPNILGTVMIMLILKIGSMASIGFEQPLSLGNDTVRDVADVISTYAYRIGIKSNRFNVATAITLFQSVINFILVIGSNALSKKLTGEGIW